ncbi:MAG: hypothetical protein OXG64_07150 [Chloroflexi bacterium]|nr:hypothetical protein [Chloroflexota bacterium]
MPHPPVGNFLITDTHRARHLEVLGEGVHVTEVGDGDYACANNCTA